MHKRCVYTFGACISTPESRGADETSGAVQGRGGVSAVGGWAILLPRTTAGLWLLDSPSLLSASPPETFQLQQQMTTCFGIQLAAASHWLPNKTSSKSGSHVFARKATRPPGTGRRRPSRGAGQRAPAWARRGGHTPASVGRRRAGESPRPRAPGAILDSVSGPRCRGRLRGGLSSLRESLAATRGPGRRTARA